MRVLPVSAVLVFLGVVGCSESAIPAPPDGATMVGDGSPGVDVPPGQDGTTGADGAVGMDVPPGVDATVSNDGPVVVRDSVVIDGPDGGRVCNVITCSMHLLQCGDCIDNDGDGRTDSDDGECLGPCDNTEGPSLLTGVGGEPGGLCSVDCYFDFGNGAGNDQCYWDHRCDPLAVAPNYPPEGSRCPYDARMVGSRSCPATQNTQCLQSCLPLTPNGCDCFGCCTFPALEHAGPGGAPGYVWLGSVDASGVSACTLARVTDPNACHACTPVRSCLNTCEPCEVCIGRPAPSAACRPAGTPDGGTTMGDSGTTPRDGGTTTGDGGTTTDAGGGTAQCPAGVQPCGLPGQSPCPMFQYCITGCCIAAPG